MGPSCQEGKLSPQSDPVRGHYCVALAATRSCGCVLGNVIPELACGSGRSGSPLEPRPGDRRDAASGERHGFRSAKRRSASSRTARRPRRGFPITEHERRVSRFRAALMSARRPADRDQALGGRLAPDTERQMGGPALPLHDFGHHQCGSALNNGSGAKSVQMTGIHGALRSGYGSA
jgi:hypothetical protein